MLRVGGTPCDVRAAGGVAPGAAHARRAAAGAGVEPLVFRFSVLLESAAAQLSTDHAADAERAAVAMCAWRDAQPDRRRAAGDGPQPQGAPEQWLGVGVGVG